MRKHFPGFIVILLLGTLSWGQGTEDSLDKKRSREEREILQEILITKLSHLSQSPGAPSINYQPDISSFYLPGEGMVFVISRFELHALMSSFPATSPNSLTELNLKMMMMNNELLSRTNQLVHIMRLSGPATDSVLKKSGAGSNTGTSSGSEAGGGSRSGEDPAPAPPVSQVPPAKSSAEKISGLEKSIEQLKTNIEATKRQIESIRSQKLSEIIEILRPILIETIANYGDSLSMVRPEESINFVISMESMTPKSRFIISASKSWIADYKAGRLTLDAFKKKVVQYND
jgi:hypothetical protein